MSKITMAGIRREIVACWPEIQKRVKVKSTIPASPVLLGTGVKTAKGENLDTPVKTKILYLAPGKRSGWQLCRYSTST